MIAFAYLLPFLACLIVRFEFDPGFKWYAYVFIVVLGELTVWLMHLLLYRNQITAQEYRGALLTDITHEHAWVEIIERKETRTDSRGRTYTVTHIEHRRHPDLYYFHTTNGSLIYTTPDFYAYVRDLWKLMPTQLHWSGSHIKGRHRYGTYFSMEGFDRANRNNPYNWIPITENATYVNKIRNSNSIFKFEKIDRQKAYDLGLLDYPYISMHDAPCIISKDFTVDYFTDALFRKFNGRYAPYLQMRLIIILFDASKGPAIAEMQRAYWQGGNKNEFIICIGLNRDNCNVEWARAFSWADDQTKEVQAAQWLMDHPEMNWLEFHDWMVSHINGWQRKHFKDFNYIHISLPLKDTLTIYTVSLIENAVVIYLACYFKIFLM